jgi:putative molybdopterin biosynthesis protein
MTASYNRVRERREARGLSQVELAEVVGLSRQSVGAIEGGRSTPAVDVALRLAKALDSNVEELFGASAANTTISAVPLTDTVTGRVALARVAGRWICYPLASGSMRTSADGLVRQVHRGVVEVDALRSEADAEEHVVLMGCAPALGLLADRLNSRPGRGRFLWIASSSTRALEALAKRRTSVAGVHLADRRTGEANVADVERHTGPDPIALITLARWEAGLVTAQGNPKRIRRVLDLARRGIRLVTREPGSGARRLLERELRSAGISKDAANSAPLKATGQLEVAHAVSLGAADVGVATRDAAIAFCLDFVPLAEERFDLAIPLAELKSPRLERLFDVMTSGEFRRELSSLGYDPASSGDKVAEIHAA